MSNESQRPKCGDPSMNLRSFLTRDTDGGVHGLFANRQVSYSFNTRVAIRKTCDFLDLCAGDEILVPDYNCGSEVDPLRHAGLQIKLYPIDRQTRIDLNELENRITPKTRAVYLIHYFGILQPNGDEVRALCDRYGLYLIEDCALSLLSGNSPADGRLGDVSVFCFYKFFPVMAGGALVINNKEIIGDTTFDRAPPFKFIAKGLLRRCAEISLGTTVSSGLRDFLRRHRSDNQPKISEGLPDVPPHYYFNPQFMGARISRLASIPLCSFNVSESIQIRRRNYQIYKDTLEGIPGVTILFPTLSDIECPLCMPVLVNHRDALTEALKAVGIPATSWWSGYNQYLDWTDCDGAHFLKRRVIALPLHQDLGENEITYIAEQLWSNLSKLNETSDDNSRS